MTDYRKLALRYLKLGKRRSIVTGIGVMITVIVIYAALNYGYAILRGCIARNLVVHGLEPCLGLHHCNAQNNFNLADDLIEPYRPLVDLYVSSYVELTGELTPKRKQQLFNLTSYLVKQGQRKYRLMTGVGRCCASLASCISEQSKGLELPQLIALEQRSNE